MKSEVSFKTSRGAEPEQFILRLKENTLPTEGDAIYAAQRQRTRILERTMRGVDVDERPFEPYSQDGPYYYYPNGRVGTTKFTAKQNKAAAKRLLKRIGEFESVVSSLPEKFQRKIPGINDNGDTGARLTRSGQGIRFDSYAAFKASLGRGSVDLRGPRAPHMLQAIAVRAGNRAFGTYGDDEAPSLNGKSQPVEEFALGIYGQEAGRARGHNTGDNPLWKRKHQRRFFGASLSDVRSMVSDISTRILARMKAATSK
ncbi:MAG: hypothetical protein KGL39_37580 [Patescibacteria group bacterium]|nr:hypothetical protein [Patescibacteria group bacterium]